ncbi:MAG: hypothetical protein HOL07_02060 [Rhodospirillaceae bacterium]|jgi:hypothetical protein|nr:hypothetical protein [Rhodospirillaceae bacterium]MBT3811015.1 hypothetical protein [Rhodospirillaceae bacterium]MBT3929894.1 hypothetical protein [Rhodospirillaceae bacterium]MBT4771259.1 hypothetical protein [Rhodospirillaceae bacterium]MBT5357103.1 hypothetical protein [Rhodospirillaceae bacterium]
MLTREDCLALCELTEGEVEAIAEHEHVPEMIAMEMGQYLCHTTDGEARIKRMIVDDIQTSRSSGNIAHTAKLVSVLRHFVEHHPNS